MTKFKRLYFDIGAEDGSNKELHRRVQEMLFAMGYEWASGAKEPILSKPYLNGGVIADNNGWMIIWTHSWSIKPKIGELIDVSWMAPIPDRETVTLGDRTYYKDELEAALSKINPV